jgi:hypothetical protein
MSSTGEQSQAKAEAEEAVELVLFQVAECYVYLVRPVRPPPLAALFFLRFV